MMRIGTGFVVSASMAIVATQAMAHVGRDVDVIRDVPGATVDPETRGRIAAALGKKDVRDAISEAFPVIMRSFGRDGESIVGRIQLAQNQDHTSRPGAWTNPNTGTPAGQVDRGGSSGAITFCHSACHSACHNACHGSRGWR